MAMELPMAAAIEGLLTRPESALKGAHGGGDYDHLPHRLKLFFLPLPYSSILARVFQVMLYTKNNMQS